MKAKHKKQAFFVGLICVVALLCAVMLSGCALTSAHADNGTGEQQTDAAYTNDGAARTAAVDDTAFVNEVGAGVLSNEAGMAIVPAKLLGNATVAKVNSCAANITCAGNGNCANYVDANGDGICDNCRSEHQNRGAYNSGTNSACGSCGGKSGCAGYIDANNDGVCDNYDSACGKGGAYCDGTRHNENAKNGVQGSGLQNGAGFQHKAHHGNGHE